MAASVCAVLLIAVQYGLVLSSPSLRLMAPGGDRPACVQGSEVMGGVYSSLPSCPPWVDAEGGCHMGDQDLTRDQCLGLMTPEEYNALPRGRPPLIPLPPAINEPRPIQSRPPGWPAGGDPPGGWPPSHPPGNIGRHYGPPGTNAGQGPASNTGAALRPGIGSSRHPSYRSTDKASSPGFGPPSPPAPPAFSRKRNSTKRKRGLRLRRGWRGSSFLRSLRRRNMWKKNSNFNLFAPPKFVQ